MKKYNVAVVGATGSVGRKLLSILAERNFPISCVYGVASRSSVGKKVSFGEGGVISIESIENFDFSKVDIVFSCTNEHVVKSYINRALDHGCTIIDKSSAFRMDQDVPLIIPEVNGYLVKSHHKIISSPNCCVIPLVATLAPLNNVAKIRRIVVSTYQSVSGAGKDAMEELYNQTKSSFMPDRLPPKIFEKQIAFNIIPKIGEILENGYSAEEEKICLETQKILGSHIGITATATRVPVFVGHSMSVNIEFENKLSATEVMEFLEESESLAIASSDRSRSLITPIEVVEEDMIYVSRIREDISCENGISLWISCDNIRKGAALNAVQIAELITEFLE
ncbi:MAG: aspartate-semialdehyde dehydrogenase [Alphaproteobacteria bacterium]|nr:aspartate-semialdehyde dehydrogenase [Alphaproteobacteria bacterium]